MSYLEIVDLDPPLEPSQVSLTFKGFSERVTVSVAHLSWL